MKEALKNLTKDMWNVPNALTIMRIILIPVYLILFNMGLDKWALAVFLIASFTDYLDGYIARKNGLITNFGKLMDPLADKIMVLTVLITLTLRGWANPWLVGIVLFKELLMVCGALLLLRGEKVIASKMAGKAATVAFMLAIVLTFFHPEFTAWGFQLDFWVLLAAVALSLCALCVYARAAYKLKKSK
ncbi:MAG: CDP-diacylglycerol--glycerol-3-phosphate 3-phosphatidyltransferase [Eubacteriales bacterium]|nr:CDP-diacylglycerol--glycerol-3-phosphate 3-phosphatidyltransferase [Eubacteriales bacterium]MDD3881056.1 CDP-diacylglycerol--glycerol-3-phosphate 3-phosphatidyltransferase [Eubacteriales bacterium]MDD4511875.1 CDP-diacylglycerol--glycerol-3-phosphate 3-phosphatidyltransferase [Eubacteriales bacterium]